MGPRGEEGYRQETGQYHQCKREGVIHSPMIGIWHLYPTNEHKSGNYPLSDRVRTPESSQERALSIQKGLLLWHGKGGSEGQWSAGYILRC